jgi:hypothetical protein
MNQALRHFAEALTWRSCMLWALAGLPQGCCGSSSNPVLARPSSCFPRCLECWSGSGRAGSAWPSCPTVGRAWRASTAGSACTSTSRHSSSRRSWGAASQILACTEPAATDSACPPTNASSSTTTRSWSRQPSSSATAAPPSPAQQIRLPPCRGSPRLTTCSPSSAGEPYQPAESQPAPPKADPRLPGRYRADRRPYQAASSDTL